MIHTETFTENGISLTRTWSDDNRYIVGGFPDGQYVEAVDPTELGRTYREGDVIPEHEMEEQEQK